jgi:pseudaminic acid cytidylyltransferase
LAALAIIPARGGSVRLPRKNIAEFLGRPIIAYTVSAAVESKCFDRVIVSTEDAEIAAIAAQVGAQVLDRAQELATSAATVVEVCFDVLTREEAAGRHYDRFACLYATAPLRNAADIRATMALLEPNRCHFAVAVTTWSLPPYQAMKMHPGGQIEAMWPDMIELRSSEIGTLVVDNGSTYAAFVDAFRRERTFLGSSMRGHLMPRRRSVDIDEPEDMAIAKLFAQEPA